jgi:preprotein translocase subunit SecF
MQRATGVVLILIGGTIAVSLMTWLRHRWGGGVADIWAAVAGVLVAAGGLLVVGGANVWSWMIAPLVLGAGAVAQRRALLAPGGPFRT